MNPKTTDEPTKPSFPIKPTSTLFPSGRTCEHGTHPVVQELGRLDDFTCFRHHMMKVQANRRPKGTAEKMLEVSNPAETRKALVEMAQQARSQTE